MDTLAYGSRMVNWAPLGKLMFAVCLLIVDIITDSLVVPLITLVIGVSLMVYSSSIRLPKIIGLMIAESLLIVLLGAVLIAIMPSGVESAEVWGFSLIGLDFSITYHSFDYAVLIFTRSLAGVTVMLAFATSTPIPYFANSLRRLHIPAEIIEIIVLVYRYSFLLLEQLQVLWNAASSRLGFASFRRSFRTVARIAVNVFITSLDIADKSGNALLCRNFNGVFPVFRPPKDITAVWVVLAVGAAAGLYLFGLYSEGWIDPASIVFG
ncbi:MAG: energy-coupling factor transporter transmembrane protein EcfT [Candidatus Methanoplasma sp.]|jgi:cobalt ECF transporter T component CbiQ|nr:energy-coupling factor transporter transmembrane protein EcfT [Candidatus Methanoplasma sp.]